MDDYKFKKEYFKLLEENFPTRQDICTEIINLEAILSLPKGTEHFLSDIHGEFEAFDHIINNCSGVIKEKVDLLFGETLKKYERQELCTLIYYPQEKLMQLRLENRLCKEWYRMTLERLIELVSLLSSKYTRSKVRKALPKQFGYIIDELINSKDSQDLNIKVYQSNIIETIIKINNCNDFIKELVELSKRLAVDHLHIIGDIYDRGSRPDSVVDLLMKYHSLDIEWGNHDILWMGASRGNPLCVSAVIYNSLKYNNYTVLENGYGISLRHLVDYSKDLYKGKNSSIDPVIKTIGMIMFKLEGQFIKKYPEYKMQDRLLLDKVDFIKAKVNIDGMIFSLKDSNFVTVNPIDPYELSLEEEMIILELTQSFIKSERLNQHIKFICQTGSVYKKYNNNLLYHGCIPLNKYGHFQPISIFGETLQGKAYLDEIDKIVRDVVLGESDSKHLDFMYFLWCGMLSPFSGRSCRMFESMFLVLDEELVEQVNPYYLYHDNEMVCNMILHEFHIYSNQSHIINGHLPIRYKDGEQPLKANGKLIMIDGGFCKAYQSKTGIAGYTLIYNSHGLRIKAHSSFESREEAYLNNRDIVSDSHILETTHSRVMIKDTDKGKEIQDKVDSLLVYLEKTIYSKHNI